MNRAKLIKRGTASAQPVIATPKKQPQTEVKQWVESKQATTNSAQTQARAAFKALFS